MLNTLFVAISIYAMFERQKQIIWSVINTASSTIFYHFDKKKKNYKTFIDNKNVDIKFSVHDVFLE